MVQYYLHSILYGNVLKSGMDFFFGGGVGEPILGPFTAGSPRVFLVGFDFGPFSIISITLNPENPLGFVLSFMASSVGKLSSLVGHSSVPFYNRPSPCIHD